MALEAAAEDAAEAETAAARDKALATQRQTAADSAITPTGGKAAPQNGGYATISTPGLEATVAAEMESLRVSLRGERAVATQLRSEQDELLICVAEQDHALEKLRSEVAALRVAASASGGGSSDVGGRREPLTVPSGSAGTAGHMMLITPKTAAPSTSRAAPPTPVSIAPLPTNRAAPPPPSVFAYPPGPPSASSPAGSVSCSSGGSQVPSPAAPPATATSGDVSALFQ